MTFWQDARPIQVQRAEPQSRRRWPRGFGRFGGGRPRRLLAVVAALLVLGAVGLQALRPDPAPAAPAPTRHPRAARPASRVVAPAWNATTLDEPQDLLVDGDGAVMVSATALRALRVGDGSELWSTQLDGLNPWAAIGADTVVVSSATGWVAVERATGLVRWRVPSGETPGAVAIATPADRSPVAIVATDEGGLAALDLGTGAVVWSERMPGVLRGVPVTAGGSVALVWEREDVRVLMVDAATGEIRWQQPIPERAGTPAVSGETLVVGAGTGDGDGRAFAFGIGDGSPRWKTEVGASFQPDSQPTIDGNDVFLVDELGGVDRLDLRSGRRIWHRALGEAVLIARPVVVGDGVSRAAGGVVVTDAAREVVTLDRATGRVRVRRRATGVPMRVVRSRDLVLVAQRLVTRNQIQAYKSDRLAGPARSRG